ncbi:RHS repeat-associated core domain-containing protein [Chryseobacterium sp.]|uniref:RHS repeat-associated core domain-containing protein n=1 Tax=Chryseobacterium sp. TaxID=1871047 RepID=UPI0026068A43|nr:RHS repeat-associated core domain-containing protein [Chryseobacterium sp.]
MPSGVSNPTWLFIQYCLVHVNSISQNYRYSTQGQEKQEDTKWSSFKWRNYDPAIGRFFNIDLLSEKYAYQSHYNFSENRVVDGRELEGLEWGSTKIFRVAPPAGSTVYGAGVTEEAKTNAINNYNSISRIVNSNIDITTRFVLENNSAIVSVFKYDGYD